MKASTNPEVAIQSAYQARQPNQHGFIDYSDEEHQTWSILKNRQQVCVKQYACEKFQGLLAELDLPNDRIPQCEEINKTLFAATGWKIEPVDALITADAFFHRLANRVFPAASFIRRRDELDYLQEPDIFHEIFGHVPMLLDWRFAEFTQAIGKKVIQGDKADYDWLARLYWFTVEFGLIKQEKTALPYGAGIVSSPSELTYSVVSETPIRKPFELIDVLRTPYRIDIQQRVYFVIESFEQLFDLTQQDLSPTIQKAQKLGLHSPSFPIVSDT